MENSRPQGAHEEMPPNRRHGFSLLEIMAVVVIIGMLTGLVGLNVVDRLDQSRVATTKTKLVQLETALEMYKIDNSRYPTSEQGLEALLRKPTAAPEPRRYPPDGYLKRRDSLNDAWDATFQYESPGHHNTRRFDLWSLGADETPGGEETDRDIGNWDDPASSGS